MKRTRMFMTVMACAAILGLLVTTGVMAAQKGSPETIQGMVEKGEKGMTLLKTDDGKTFNVLGKNMTEMVGKTVKVTGTLTKGGKHQSIVVTGFEPVSE